MGQRLHNAKEKVLTGLIYTGIFLPARLFFYTYVSQYWFGSFGLMTVLILLVTYLAKKGKMGYVGYLVNKHTQSFARGKFGKFAMAYLIFSIYLSANAIYGIEHPPELKQKVVGMLAAQGVTDMDTLTTQSSHLSWSSPMAWLGPLFSLALIIVPNNLGHSIFGIVNDYTNGWALHFITVSLVSEIEVFGLVIYFRYFYKIKN